MAPQDHLACTNSALRTESHALLSIRSEEDGASGSLRWVVQEIGQAHLILREVTCSMSENIES
jgi:hypothetical protein